MKTLTICLVAAVLALSLTGCLTPSQSEEAKAHQAKLNAKPTQEQIDAMDAKLAVLDERQNEAKHGQAVCFKEVYSGLWKAQVLDREAWRNLPVQRCTPQIKEVLQIEMEKTKHWIPSKGQVNWVYYNSFESAYWESARDLGDRILAEFLPTLPRPADHSVDYRADT
jgi:hypothetical protein